MGRRRKPRGKLPAHIHVVRAKGREYFYYHPYRGTQRDNGRVALPGLPYEVNGCPNQTWWTRYREAAGEAAVPARSGSFKALIGAYQASPEWMQLAEATRRDYERYLSVIERSWGHLLVSGVAPKHVLALRDQFAGKPAAANYLIRTLSAMISWSVPRGYRSDNPCRHVRKLKIGDGYAPWPWQLIELLRNFGPGWMWQAAALALYTGQRQEDVLTMKWAALKGGLIEVRQGKTGKGLIIPAHQNLLVVLSDMPRKSVTMLTSTRGTPWTQSGFRASWNGALEPPVQKSDPLPHAHPLWPIRRLGFVFHGLRKSAVVMLLEAGCTDAEVSAITGQSRQMVEHYARQVNQKRLAAAAILKWERSAAGRAENERAQDL